MIINVGARTDIVHRFTPWLLNRLREGFVITRNPLFPNRVTRYELTPDKVDAILFCSKNYEPILPYMAEIARDYRIYCYYTITAYGEDIEPNVPDIDTSIETLGELSSIVGKGKVAWRYDPVLLTRKYTVERHLETFADMAARLAGSVDRCIFSFVEVYKKLRTNMPELVMLREKDMLALAEGMGKSRARTAWKYRPAARISTILRTASVNRAALRWISSGGRTAARSESSSTEGCARGATASKAGISAHTIPARTAAAIAMRTAARRKWRKTARSTTRSLRSFWDS